MGKRGPPPKPAHLKLIQGNPGKKVIPDDLLDPPELEQLGAPETLTDLAKQRWGEMAPLLSRNGLLTVLDVPLLALYCEAWADCERAKRHLQEHGETQRNKNSGLESLSPWYTIHKDSEKTARDILAAFGMGPAYRSKLRTDAPRGHSKKTPKGGLLD